MNVPPVPLLSTGSHPPLSVGTSLYPSALGISSKEQRSTGVHTQCNLTVSSELALLFLSCCWMQLWITFLTQLKWRTTPLTVTSMFEKSELHNILPFLPPSECVKVAMSPKRDGSHPCVALSFKLEAGRYCVGCVSEVLSWLGMLQVWTTDISANVSRLPPSW